MIMLLSQRNLGNDAKDSQEGWTATDEHISGEHLALSFH